MSAPEHIWAWCDTCQDTSPVNGVDVREYLSNGAPHSYIDLVCAVCFNIIATISIGPPDGSPPVQPPLHLPPPDPAPTPADEAFDSPLRRIHQVRLRRDRDLIVAQADALQGIGDGLPDALRDLAAAIERSDLTIWVPPAAKPYTEDGQLKAVCPECGHVKAFGGFSKVIAYICEGCGLGIDVEE
jgi:hypothetical protein